MDQRRRYGLLDFYGSEYLPPVGQDSADVISTDPRMARQPQRFGRWQPDVLASGEAAKAGVFGKALGLLGLDADGNRAATSWTDAAKHTAGNVINIPQDVGNQLLALQDYQPAYGTGAVDDKGLAARQAASTFGLAGLAPMGGVLAGRGAARNPVAPVIPELKGRPELPRQAAFEYQGQTFEGPIHGSALAMAEDWFGPSLWDDWKQPNGWQTAREGYVTTSGRFVTRKEADDLLRQSGLLNYERLNDSEHFALHSSELNDLRSKRHELFSANPKEAAVPRMVVQGFRGYNPDHGIGPGVDRPQVVWATPDKGLADIFGRNTVTAPVEMRFENPYVVDAKGARFDNIPVRDGKGLLSYLAPTVRHHIDDLALDKRDAGYDGMIVKNVRETGKDNVARTADQLVALKRGTVFDPASGDLLWANSKEAAVPGLIAQVRDTVSNLSSSYGENPLQFIDRAIQGDDRRSGALMDAIRSAGIDSTAIPSAVRDSYRGGQYNVGEAKQRVRELDAEIGKLYVKHGNNERAVLADPSYPALNNEMIALTGGAMSEPSKFARDFDALPRMNKLDLFANSRDATVPGILAQAEAQAAEAKPDPYQYALQLQARRKALGLPN